MLKRLLFIAGLSFLWIFLGSWFVGTYMAPKPVADIPDLVFNDLEAKFASSDHYWFKAGDSKLEVGQSTAEMFKNLAAHLHSNPDRKVTLHGLYLEEELNTTVYENLGLARAEALQQYLQDLGLPASQMETNFEQVSESPIIDGVFYDAVDLNFDYIIAQEQTAEYPTEDAPLAKEEIEPLIIYGDAIDQLIMNPSLMHFIEKIKAHQVEYPDQKLLVIGHAEQMDNVSASIDASKSHANTVRKFLMKNGISSKSIKWEGKGAQEPHAARNNPNVSIKNNRVEIQLEPMR